jgi:hypothetical protein
MWKICLGLAHAVNFHVRDVSVFVAVLPLLVENFLSPVTHFLCSSIATLALALATL